MLKKNEISESSGILHSHLQTIIPFAEKIITMENSGKLQVEITSLLTSLIHMSLDRWFRTKNRLHEMVIYEFLSRYYAFEIARKNNIMITICKE